MDALANSGMMISPMVYGGIGVAIAVIGGFIFLFRRKTKLQLKQETIQAAYSTQQEQKDFTANMVENLSAPEKANDLQASNAFAEAERQPAEDTSEQGGVDITELLHVPEPSESEDEPEETHEPVEDNPDDNYDAKPDDNSDAKPPEPEQPKSEGAMLDLFTTEIEDDNNATKLAAFLDNVDINDIMGEAQSLIQKLRGDR